MQIMRQQRCQRLWLMFCIQHDNVVYCECVGECVSSYSLCCCCYGCGCGCGCFSWSLACFAFSWCCLLQLKQFMRSIYSYKHTYTHIQTLSQTHTHIHIYAPAGHWLFTLRFVVLYVQPFWVEPVTPLAISLLPSSFLLVFFLRFTCSNCCCCCLCSRTMSACLKIDMSDVRTS